MPFRSARSREHGIQLVGPATGTTGGAGVFLQVSREIHDMAHQVCRSVHGDGHVVAAAGVPHHDVSGTQHGPDGVPAIGHGPLLISALTMPRQIDGDRLVAEPLQFRDRPAPAPCSVKAAVDQYEPHGHSTVMAATSAGQVGR
jgi:hypothetical protein